MTIDANRSSLGQAVVDAAASWTEYPLAIEYDNRTLVDPNQQRDPFLCVELKFNGGHQADLSEKPFHRLLGFVILTAKVREGEGTVGALKLLEHFYPKLQHRKIGDMHMEFAQVISPKPVGGWYGVSAVIPFRADKTY